MEYWKGIIKNPTGTKAIDEFAVTIGKIPKIVFSKTLKSVDWETARLAKRSLKEEVLALKQSTYGDNKNILAGSRGLIVALANLNLIDEFQLCVQPIILGDGLPLFKNIHDRINLKLFKTKTFTSGSINFFTIRVVRETPIKIRNYKLHNYVS